MRTHFLFTDGGARGNPGPAGAGIVLKDQEKQITRTHSAYLGVCTNNEAEYKALVLGLELALKEGVENIDCTLDSELIVRQLNGQYKVKNERMRLFFNEVKDLEKEFSSVVYRHVKRDFNKEADKLVNEAIDGHK